MPDRITHAKKRTEPYGPGKADCRVLSDLDAAFARDRNQLKGERARCCSDRGSFF
jgi:hypothetical protein